MEKRVAEKAVSKELESKEEKTEATGGEITIDLTCIRGIGPKWSEKLKYSSKDLVEKVGVSQQVLPDGSRMPEVEHYDYYVRMYNSAGPLCTSKAASQKWNLTMRVRKN